MARLFAFILLGLPVTWIGIGCGTENAPEPVANSPAQKPEQNSPRAAPRQAEPAQPEPGSDKSETVVAPTQKLVAPKRTADIVDKETESPLSLSLPILEAPEPMERDSKEADAAFAQLVEAFRSGQPGQWNQAETAILAEGVNAVPALLDGLDSADRQTRELASMMLAQVLPDLLFSNDASQRPNEKELLDRLRPHLRAESVEVRINAAVVLSMIEFPAQELVPVLEELLKSDKAHIRMMAVVALGGLGSAAAPAVPRIKEMSLADADAKTKAAAAEALSRLQSPE